MNDIIKIIYDYSINNKILSRDAISRLLDIILTENNLHNIISYEISKDSIFDISNIWNKNILAMFDMDSIIYIYYLEIIKSIHKKKYLTKYDNNLNEIEISFKKNIMILETIFHEIEHANQLTKIKNIYDGDIDTQIYRYEYDYLYPPDDISPYKYLKRSIIYQKNYNISFIERMANIISFEKTINILSQLDKKYTRLCENEIKILDNFLIQEYHNALEGPTIRFLNNIDCYQEFLKYEYETMQNMSFNNRLRYGFMITNAEYQKRIKK